MDKILATPQIILNNLDALYTFFLLVLRTTGLMIMMPGIGMGQQGLRIRSAAILVLAFASVQTGTYAEFPDSWFTLLGMMFSEFSLGMIIGTIPLMVIAGVQTAGQLTSTTMGLGAAQLVDPNLGVNVSTLSRVMGDLTILLFLLSGGHYALIYAVSGLGGDIVPGSFAIGNNSLQLLVEKSADIFTAGVMISAPVIVALLLTQFVMGLISKAVPTVNIFIVSFPLTIGIGLVLTTLSLPELMVFASHQFSSIDDSILTVLGDVIPTASP
ncbi:MAG: hypothetical protein D6719_06835 [Candidatus Dadabacteria bacterium]|nr:MAG: hypothetical protein D6719_06835 [Candidatus Dadabacteria bacterium]